MEVKMKLHMRKKIYSSLALLALTNAAFAGHAKVMDTSTPPAKTYIGIFGGGGSSNEFKFSQFGSAFLSTENGGPLAVNAFGHMNSHSAWFVGAQLGYQAPGILLSSNSQWSLVPAAELEGYYFGNKTFNGHLINDTARLPEHDFYATYPMRRSVFLTNAVLTFSHPCYLIHPYIGLGIGGAVVRISGAESIQTVPAEPGLNHYNSSDSDTDATFAGQIKAGLSYDVNDTISLFAEYRWLYLSGIHLIFGSTVVAGHSETTSWQVKIDPQQYNMGAVGIRFNI
jgi:opacity protein-like surface antigen